MEESVTYQAILEKGAVREARRNVFLIGRDRFGPPRGQVKKLVESIDDLSRLEELIGRILHVDSWDELLALRETRSRRQRRKD